MKTPVAAIAALILLFGSAGTAQTFSELLQKAIYTQDTVGDVDGAIRIYRQIVAGAPAQSEVRLQAQSRLQSAEAQRRLAIVAAMTPDSMSQSGRELGTLIGHTYRHAWTGVTFDVPEGWRVGMTLPSSDSGELVALSPAEPVAYAAVWMRMEQNDPQSIVRQLERAPIVKVGQRQGFVGYRLREGSVQSVYIGGHRATVAIADYTESDRPMSEYMTWIYTERTHAFFFTRVAADKLEQLRPQFDSLVYSAIIP